MQAQTSMQYQLRLHRVIDYIYQNLSEDWMLEQRDRQEYRQQHRQLLPTAPALRSTKTCCYHLVLSLIYRATRLKSNLLPVSLVGLTHQGDYLSFDQTFDKLAMLDGKADLRGPGSRFFGLYYDNPLTVAAKDLRAMACVSVLVRKTPRMMRGLFIPKPHENTRSELLWV